MANQCIRQTKISVEEPSATRRIAQRIGGRAAIVAALLGGSQAVPAHERPHEIALVTPASNAVQQTFVRIVNRSDSAGTASISAIDDAGEAFGPVTLSLGPRETVHLNSQDLEGGNRSKGLSGGVGDGEGNWRLSLDSELDIEPLAYIRTTDGFLTSMHDLVAEDASGRYRVPLFNPGSNRNQQSRLRLINAGDSNVDVTISGFDDDGMPPPNGNVLLTLPAGEAHMITAQQLESGDSALTGRFGDGTGKWTLLVSANGPIQVMNLMLSVASGNLTNLSGTPYEPHGSALACDPGVFVEGGDGNNRSIDTAQSLGDLTAVKTVRARRGSVHGIDNTDDYYRFTLSDAGTTRDTSRIRVELRNLTQNADLYLLNADGRYFGVSPGFSGSGSIYSLSANGGTEGEVIEAVLADGTYYIHVSAVANATIGYELRFSNNSEVPGRTIASALDLGDVSGVADILTREAKVDPSGNDACLHRNRFYRFTLSDAGTTRDTSRIRVELRNLTQNADLYLLNADGRYFGVSPGFSGSGSIYSLSANGGTEGEVIEAVLADGTYYIHVSAVANATIGYELRFSNNSEVPGRTIASALDLGDLSRVATTRTVEGNVDPGGNEANLFRNRFYRFTLSDAGTTRDTSRIRVELRNLTQNADLYLLNADGRYFGVSPGFSGSGSIYSLSANGGTEGEVIEAVLADGTYYIHVSAMANATIGYELRYGPGGG